MMRRPTIGAMMEVSSPAASEELVERAAKPRAGAGAIPRDPPAVSSGTPIGRNVSVRLTSELVRDFSTFESLADAWDELLLASDTPTSFFLSSSALVPFWKHYGSGRELAVVLVRDEAGQLAGAAPLYVQTVGRRLSRHRRLALLGSPESGCDYLDILARPGLRAAVLREVFECLRRNNIRWDVLNLYYILEDSPTIALVCEGATGPRFWVRVAPSSVCPYAALKPTWEEFARGIGRKTRQNINQWSHALYRLHPEARFELITDAERVPSVLATMIRYVQAKYGHQFDHDYLSWKDQAISALRAGYLRLWVLWLGATPASIAFTFLFNRRVYAHEWSYKPDLKALRAGAILMAQTIRAAIAEGALVYDFKRGADAYKMHWADGERRTVNVHAVRRSLWGAWVLFWEYSHFIKHARVTTDSVYRRTRRAARDTVLALGRWCPGLVPDRLLARAQRGAAAEVAWKAGTAADASD